MQTVEQGGRETGRRRVRLLPDLVLVVVIFVAGAAVGAAYRRVFVASGAPEEYAQREFGAAVALACGHGFIDPGYTLTPALDEFLALKRDRMTCADLPATIPSQRPNLTQGLYRYLMSAASLVWALTGVVSWSGLTPIFAVAYATTLVAAYGLFRIGIGRLMSAMATFALLVSAIHLGYLPYLRDYAKAPFILLLMLIMARFAAGPLTWRRAGAFGIAFGVVLGIGFGFRNDLLINVVPWAAVVLLCLRGSLRSNLKLKTLCLAASAAAFLIVAWPILAAYSRGSNSGHVALLGLMSSFNVPLGLAGSIYDWGYSYNDGFANRLVNSFTYRQYGHPVAYLTGDYDRAMVVYVLKIARHWPADTLARAYASVLKVLEFPFTVNVYTNPLPHGIQHPSLLALYDIHMNVLRALNGVGAIAAALALLVISARSLRTAVTLLLFLLYFAGYPAIQFTVRHFFHLEFIAWWAIAFLAEWAAVSLWRRRFWRPAQPAANPSEPRRWLPAAARVGVFALLATVLVAGSLLALRAYQTRHVRWLLDRAYLRADREPVAITKVPAPAGRVLFDASAVWSGRNPAELFSTAYIIGEFSPARCDARSVDATFRYEATVADADHSHAVNVPLIPGDQSTFVFFPAFFDAVYSHFTGIEVPAADAECLASVSRVRAERIPEVLLDVTFTPHWSRAKLYQTLTRFETPRSGEVQPVVDAQPP